MKKFSFGVLFGFAQLILCGPAAAGTADIGPVYIERVTVVALASGGHQAGNMELKIQGGFAVPPGVACDGTYITTLKSVDADQRLFRLASVAQVVKQPVYLRITDDPAYTAFGGRCGLVWLSMAQ